MEYWGDDPAVYKRTYEIKTKDDPKVWASLIHMFKVLNETPPDKLEAALSPLLDIDGALRFLAVDNALVNTDGYWTRASDYSIYQDVKGRFHVIPHDMNEALINEGGGRGRGGPVGPPPDFAVADRRPADRRTSAGRRSGWPAAWRHAAGDGPARRPRLRPGRRRSDARSARSASTTPRSRCARSCWRCRRCGRAISPTCAKSPRTWLDWKKLGPMARTYQDLIREEVKLDTRKLYSTEAFESGLETGEQSLKKFVDERREYLLKVTDPKAAVEVALSLLMDERHSRSTSVAVERPSSVRAGGGSQCRCCSPSCSRTRPTAARWRASTRRCAIAERGRMERRGFGGPRLALGTPAARSAARPRRRRRRSATSRSTTSRSLRTVFIQFPAANWEALLEPNYRRDVDVPATVTIDGKTYRDVGVRFRGNSSYRMVPAGFKRSLNLSLDAVHADQASRRLQHAQPAERQRGSDLRPDDPLLGDRAQLPARSRRSTSCAS